EYAIPTPHIAGDKHPIAVANLAKLFLRSRDRNIAAAEAAGQDRVERPFASHVSLKENGDRNAHRLAGHQWIVHAPPRLANRREHPGVVAFIRSLGRRGPTGKSAREVLLGG